jgi:hypothetical protein
MAYTNIPLSQATDVELQIACKGQGLDEVSSKVFNIICEPKITKAERKVLEATAAKFKFTLIKVDIKNRVTKPGSMVAFQNCTLVKGPTPTKVSKQEKQFNQGVYDAWCGRPQHTTRSWYGMGYMWERARTRVNLFA